MADDMYSTELTDNVVYDLMEMLKEEEGFRSYAYADTEGYLTIGYGRMIDKRLGGGISVEEAQALLYNDVSIVFSDLRKIFDSWFHFTAQRQLALASARFNLGPTRFRGFKKMITAVIADDWDKAADELLDSKAAAQLPNRYNKLAGMLRRG